MSKHPLAIILFIALTMLAASASAEVGQKRSKCEEGIGCRDEQKKAPDAPKYAPKNDKAPGNMKATSPGLGVGVTGNTRVPGGRMEPLPGAGGYAGSTPAEQAFLNEVCGSRQEQAELEPYQSSRRVLAPELNATDCIQPGTSKSSFGPGFKNVCPYWVVFRFCAYKPAPDAWTEAFDCEKTGGGTEIIGPRREIAAHTANAEQIHWAGCRHPEGTGTDYKFITGQGYRFNCMAWQSGKVREAVAKSKAPACEVAEVAQDAAVQAEVEQQRARLPELIALARKDQAEAQAAFEQKFADRMKQAQPPQQVQASTQSTADCQSMGAAASPAAGAVGAATAGNHGRNTMLYLTQLSAEERRQAEALLAACTAEHGRYGEASDRAYQYKWPRASDLQQLMSQSRDVQRYLPLVGLFGIKTNPYPATTSYLGTAVFPKRPPPTAQDLENSIAHIAREISELDRRIAATPYESYKVDLLPQRWANAYSQCVNKARLAQMRTGTVSGCAPPAAPNVAPAPARNVSAAPQAPAAGRGDCTGSAEICNDIRMGWPPGTTLCMKQGRQNCLPAGRR